MLTANKIYKILKENGKTDKNFTEWLNEQKYLFEVNVGECPDANKELFLKYLNKLVENENINQSNNNLNFTSMGNTTETKFNLKEFVVKNKKPIILGSVIVATIIVGSIIYKRAKRMQYYYGDYGYDDYNYSNYYGDDEEKVYIV